MSLYVEINAGREATFTLSSYNKHPKPKLKQNFWKSYVPGLAVCSNSWIETIFATQVFIIGIQGLLQAAKHKQLIILLISKVTQFGDWFNCVTLGGLTTWQRMNLNYFSQSRPQVETRRHVGRSGRELPRCFSTKWHFKIRALFVKLDCGSNRSCKVCPLFRNYPFENV